MNSCQKISNILFNIKYYFKKNPIEPFIFFILFSEFIGILSSIISSKGIDEFANVSKSILTPPNIVFPIVWTILYALMGISQALIFNEPPSIEQSKSLLISFVQLFVNFIWSIIFFNFKSYFAALLCLLILWVLIVIMIKNYNKVNRTAALLQIPYLLWVTFAIYLTFVVFLLNK